MDSPQKEGISVSHVDVGERIRQLRLGLGMSVRTRARQKLISTWSPASIEALGPMDGSGRLEPVMITMEPGGRSGKYPVARSGEKFALIFDGEVTLTLGDEVYVLRKGDTITFTPTTLHQWENIGVGPAQVVIVSVRTLP